MHRAKPIPLKMHKTKGSLREGAVDYTELRKQLHRSSRSESAVEGECVTIKHIKTSKLRGLLPPLTRSPVSLRLGHARALTPHRGVIHYPRAASLPLGGRLFVSPNVTQIGRKNKFSAENYVSRTVEDAGPYSI